MQRPDQGGTAAEYAIIAAWIGIAIFLTVMLLGGTVQDFFQRGLDGFTPNP